MHRTRRTIVIALATLALLATACGDDGSESSDTTEEDGGEYATINVPDDHDTIQAAVDAASPGDLVLIAPGTYEEAVDVETENLTIRASTATR